VVKVAHDAAASVIARAVESGHFRYSHSPSRSRIGESRCPPSRTSPAPRASHLRVLLIPAPPAHVRRVRGRGQRSPRPNVRLTRQPLTAYPYDVGVPDSSLGL
jgi:hypothetical protein